MTFSTGDQEIATFAAGEKGFSFGEEGMDYHGVMVMMCSVQTNCCDEILKVSVILYM